LEVIKRETSPNIQEVEELLKKAGDDFKVNPIFSIFTDTVYNTIYVVDSRCTAHISRGRQWRSGVL
jgi:hypothetical protein